MTARRVLLTLSLGAVVGASAAPLGAQSMASRVGELIRFGNCDRALCLSTGPGPHGAHYINAAASASAELLDFLTSSITASVDRLPISATSGGTTFRFVGGAPVRSTTSAGPIFAERAPTLGRGRILIGVNTTGISYDKLRGIPTEEISVNLAHQDVGTPGLGDPTFEDDVVGIVLNMNLDLQVTTLLATYGLTDDVDVSVAVPVIHASLDGRGVGTVSSVSGTPSGLHFFGTPENPSFTAASAVNGSSTGLGDVAARVKVRLPKIGSGVSTAFLGDVRIPTGDADEFRGTGDFSARGLFVLSSSINSFSPHLNAGYALRTGDRQSDALLATAGFDQLVTPAVTLAVDVLSEWQVGSSEVRLPPPIIFISPNQTIAGTNIPDRRDNLVGLSAGGRFLWSGFTLVLNGLLPLTDSGLQSNFVWTAGLERSF